MELWGSTAQPLITWLFLHRNTVWSSPHWKLHRCPRYYTLCFTHKMWSHKHWESLASRYLLKWMTLTNTSSKCQTREYSLCNSICKKYKTSHTQTHLRNHKGVCPQETEVARSLSTVLGMAVYILFLDLGAGSHRCDHCVDAHSAAQEDRYFFCMSITPLGRLSH